MSDGQIEKKASKKSKTGRAHWSGFSGGRSVGRSVEGRGGAASRKRRRRCASSWLNGCRPRAMFYPRGSGKKRRREECAVCPTLGSHSLALFHPLSLSLFLSLSLARLLHLRLHLLLGRPLALTPLLPISMLLCVCVAVFLSLSLSPFASAFLRVPLCRFLRGRRNQMVGHWFWPGATLLPSFYFSFASCTGPRRFFDSLGLPFFLFSPVFLLRLVLLLRCIPSQGTAHRPPPSFLGVCVCH